MRAMKEIDFRRDLLPLKDKLFRLAARILLDRAEAEDVTQETLLRVWERKDSLDTIRSLENFCLTVCRNLALDRVRSREATQLSLEAGGIDRPDTAPSAQERMEQEERRQRVARIFDRLPEKLRTVMQLRDIEEKTTRETADIMGLTEENVKVMLFRARKTVREAYDKQENNGL
mgnify:FL=1